MRVLVVLALIAVLAGTFFAMQFAGSAGEPPVTPSQAPPSRAEASNAGTQSSTAEAPGLAKGTVATRLRAEPPAVEPLAASPTACLLVVDHSTSKPIPGAVVRRVQGRTEVAFSDERGLAPLPLTHAEQLAVIMDGYLLRRVPTRLQTTEKEPQEVRLVRDEWSPRRRLNFVNTNGSIVSEAFVRLRPRDAERAGTTPSPVLRTDAVLKRAWDEHTMLAALPVCADVPVQLGNFEEDRVHRLENGAEVRFLAPGTFLFEAATVTGFVARGELRIEASNATPATIELAEGVFVRGIVASSNASKPLASAEITLQGGDPLGLVTTTTGDGAFCIGPLLRGAVTLNVRHGDHEPMAYGPLTAPSEGLRIELRPLPQSALRGRVRMRPDLKPVAGASVVWALAGTGSVKATTAADGTFVLMSTGASAGRILISAPGCMQYVELVDVGAAFADYDLWPDPTSARVEKGITAVLAGVVLNAEKRPVAGVAVRWQPVQRVEPVVMPGRRFLAGATLELSPVITTGSDGSFRIETTHFGPGRLTLVDGTAAVEVTAIAGQITDGIRVQR